jgi:hypothetical protein
MYTRTVCCSLVQAPILLQQQDHCLCECLSAQYQRSRLIAVCFLSTVGQAPGRLCVIESAILKDATVLATADSTAAKGPFNGAE